MEKAERQMTTMDIIEQIEIATNNKMFYTKLEERLKDMLINRHISEITNQLAEKEEPFGTVTIVDGDAIVKVIVPKNVEWDQDKLSELYDKLKRETNNVSEYIDVKYAVPEGKYKSWPQELKDRFIDFRTVSPKKMVVKLSEKKE